MNTKEEKYLDEAVALHIATLNAIQVAYSYKQRSEDHKKRPVNEVVETCRVSGTFHVYDRWTFLERAAKFSLHIFKKTV